MEDRIFTDKQKEFFYKNYRELQNILKEKEKIENEEKNFTNKRVKMLKLIEEEKQVRNNLAPFEIRDNEYLKREEKILNLHGYSKNDIPDETTIKEIVSLKEQMRKESEKLPDNLVINKEKNNYLEEMFKNTNNEKKEKGLESMFKEDNTNEKISELAKRFND